MRTKRFSFSAVYLCATLCVILNVAFAGMAHAQDTQNEDKPVIATFNSGTFLENQTAMTNGRHVLEFVIDHRFGKISDGSKMAWGIYSPSNIRLSLDFGILKNLQIGLGATKNDRLVDGSIKWVFYNQTTSGKKPFTLAYYANFGYRGDPTSLFNNPAFREVHRFSYFHELLFARKFSNAFSLQLAPMYAHYNLVETAVPSSSTDSAAVPVRHNDNFGFSSLARIHIKGTASLLCEFDMNLSKLKIPETDAYKNPQPVIALGAEFTTSAHSFQIFVTTGESIVNQKNMVYNKNYFLGKGDIKSGLMIGFNITRVFY